MVSLLVLAGCLVAIRGYTKNVDPLDKTTCQSQMKTQVADCCKTACNLVNPGADQATLDACNADCNPPPSTE